MASFQTVQVPYPCMPISPPSNPRHFIVCSPNNYASKRFATIGEACEHAQKNATKRSMFVYEALSRFEPTTPPVKSTDLYGYEAPAEKSSDEDDDVDF